MHKNAYQLKPMKGKRFGRLIVKEYVGKSKWLCICDCGNIKAIDGNKLRSHETLSCGCLQKERASEANIRHGQTNTRLYAIYRGIKARCKNPHVKEFERYGGRGITICEEWAQSFEAFAMWANENGYADNLTIDRIDNDKGYSPENCRWADYTTQGRNRRNVRKLTYKGITQTFQEWSQQTGVPFHTLRYRILKLHWSTENAFNVPVLPGGKAAKLCK